MSTVDILKAHEARGRRFTADGVDGFALDVGDGDPVLCLHGVPMSGFLYRKVVDELAARGLRGVAPDLVGLGLSARPENFDYSWSGLGRWMAAAVDELGLDDFHLVVHDIGGPVGFELAALMPERIRSLTICNTLVDVASFRRPWPMNWLAIPGVGELMNSTMNAPAFLALLRRMGIADWEAVDTDELRAHLDLIRLGDRGRALLKIMRGFQTDERTEARYHSVLRGDFPRQVVWGALDPALPRAVHGEQARRAAGVDTVHDLPAKHFLQEDQAGPLAGHVAVLAGAR